jgi:excisionase family DNA binding protein
MERKKNSDFLTIDEAAQLVGISHWTLRMWLRRGRLTRYKTVSRTVIRRSELLELTRPKRVAEDTEDQAKEI